MFEGKVALVIGASSGIGRATACAFGREGAKVVVVARRDSEGEETVSLARQEGGEALFLRADVQDEAQVRAAVAGAIEAFGRIDCAVNNAGVEQFASPLPDQSEADWDRIVGINAKGAFFCMKHEVAAMLPNGGGAIVNISSVAAHVATPGTHLYTASKHAVLGMTRSVAIAYARQGIRVNEVAPGVIETPLIARFAAGNEGIYDYLKSVHPIGRIGRPEEIASAVLWLCSPGAAFVIGHSLVVDGGMTAQ
jgi:NAD(P)-dependent dehydrogenase (short-subunit alcohol dehydrogenase family)